MDIETLHQHCLAMAAVEETYPFGEDVMVMKVMGKMFLLANLEAIPLTVNVKCNPTLAEALREEFDDVSPGYHMNKRHWNTVVIEGSVPDNALLEWIAASYVLVVKGLKKKQREELALIKSSLGPDAFTTAV